MALLDHLRPRRLRRIPGALEMDIEHVVEVGLRKLRKRVQMERAGVVDQDVDAAEAVDGRLDRRVRVGAPRDVADGRDGRPARRRDQLDDLVRRLRRTVVDDDLRATPGQEQRMLAAEAATAAGDDRDPAVETELGAHAAGSSTSTRSHSAQNAGSWYLAVTPPSTARVWPVT